MKEYNFNDFQICDNPTWIYKSKSNKVEIFLGIASFEGYWESSISFRTLYSGFGFLPSKDAIQRNKMSFKEAVVYGITRVAKEMESTLGDSSSSKPAYLNELLLKEKQQFHSWANSAAIHDYSKEFVLKIENARNVVQTSLF